MLCEFLNKSISKLNITVLRDSDIKTLNWSECYKGLNEYSSDDDLANVDLFYGYPEPLLKFAAVFCVVFAIIGIPGNLITIIALTNYKKVHNATAIFIINLSCSDFLFSCIIFPITAELFWKKTWTTGKIMCWLFPFANFVLTAIGVFSIVAITVNRYVMVSHPNYYPRIYQSRNIIIMLTAIWIGAVTMMMPSLLELWGRFSLDPRVGFCTVIPDEHGNTPKTPLVVMGFVFPCIFIIVCYSRIMYLVRKSTAKAKSSPTPATPSNLASDSSRDPELSTREISSSDQQEDFSHEDIESAERGFITRFKDNIKHTFKQTKRTPAVRPTRRDKRLKRMIMSVMISFFACRLPIMMAKTIHQNWSSTPYGNVAGYILLYMSNCINPIIYVVLSKEYRQAYMNIFTILKNR